LDEKSGEGTNGGTAHMLRSAVQKRKMLWLRSQELGDVDVHMKGVAVGDSLRQNEDVLFAFTLFEQNQR
jgi:hypothetical protein